MNLTAIENADHMTDPRNDKDGWYSATIHRLIERVRELEGQVSYLSNAVMLLQRKPENTGS